MAVKNNTKAHIKIYRVQDSEGRGPWRPGFSLSWVESRPDHDLLKPMYGDLDSSKIYNAMRMGEHWGCGCRTAEKLKRWINQSEYEKLLGFGYKSVILNIDRILDESDIQTLFSRRTPLWKKFTIFNLYEVKK